MPPTMGGVSRTSNLEKIEIDQQKLEEYRTSFLESIRCNKNGTTVGVVSLENVSLQYRKEMALTFIKEERPGYVIGYLKKYNFDIADENEIALKVIEMGGLINVAERVRSFKKLDRDIAVTLIEAGEGYNIIIGIDHVGNMDTEEACKLIFSGKNPKSEQNTKVALERTFSKDWLSKHGIV